MLINCNMVQFCIDAIVATPSLPRHVDNQIQVDVEHNSVKYSNNIFLDEDSGEKTLDIKEKLYIDNNNPDYLAIVSIYVEEMKIYEKEFDLRQNMIGTINSDVNFPFCLIFRIINSQVNDIVIHNVPKYRLSDFELAKILGNGSSGVAYKAIDHHGHPHVLKVPNTKIDINNLNSNGMREIVSMIALPRHPCMIRLDGFIWNHNHGIILVLEYASRGRISNIDFKSLEESRAFKILYGLFSCVAFIHDHGFIHRDLHPSNILVTEDYEARLIDFDVSRFYGDDLTHNVGHQGYMAPEMMGNGNYDEMVDEFSLGVLISDIFDKSSPFYLLKFLLNNDNTAKRFRCSEICTLLECECLINISSEAESYITELSRYHESEELRDYSIFMLMHLTNFICNSNACCNIIKLFDFFDDQEARHIYSISVLFYENFALDTDYFYYNDEQEPKSDYLVNNLSFNVSVDKINYLYNFLLKRQDIKIVSIHFFAIFWEYDWSFFFLKSISSDLLNFIFEFIIEKLANSNAIFAFLVSLYRKACRFDAKYLIYKFSMVAFEHYQTMNSIVLTSFEYWFEIGDQNNEKGLCMILASEYTNLDTFDYVKGKYYAKKGFKMGNFKCAKYLSKAYYYKNKMQKAMKYLKISAKHGDAESMCILGSLYMGSDFIQQNIEKGIKYLKKSADKGYPRAQSALASLNFFGSLIPRNYHQALWYNTFALNQGYKEASWIQAMFYFFGIEVEQDFVKARILFEQSIDTSRRHHALKMLSDIHLYGIGVEISIEKANYYLSLLVKEGVRRNEYPIKIDEAYIRRIREKLIPKIIKTLGNLLLCSR